MKITAAEMTASQRRRFFMRVLMLVMCVGIVAGVLLVAADTERKYVKLPFFSQGLLKMHKPGSFLKIFSSSFFPLELILTAQMMCGFFAVGQPLCLLTLLLRGMAGGISAALIYVCCGLKGFFIILILLLPVLLFNMYILVLGARESIKSSNILVRFAIGRSTEKRNELKIYFVKFLVLTIFSLITSAIDGILTYFLTDILIK